MIKAAWIDLAFPALSHILHVTVMCENLQCELVYVVVQFYPWFKFCALLFLGMVMYDNNMIMSLKQKKIKLEPQIKLNHNIYFKELHSCSVNYY